MMVNSNVPHYSNLASELHRKYLFKFNCSNLFCLQFDQTRTWWLRCANRLQTCSISTPAAIWWNCTASIHFERWLQQCSGKIKHVPYFRANIKLEDFFPKRVLLCSLSSSFHWLIQLCNETLRHFARFRRLFRSVIWSVLVPLKFLFSFFPFFLIFF